RSLPMLEREKIEFPFRLLDFRAGFKQFCEEHGEPLDDGNGRLLFFDGWRFSATSYKGPAEPPPSDPVQLAELRRTYWRLRREEVLRQIGELKKQLTELEKLQQEHSLPLFIAGKTVWHAGQGRWRKTKSKPLNLQDMIDRMNWLLSEEKTCDSLLSQERFDVVSDSSVFERKTDEPSSCE
ncbi:MAG: hypothetical protein L0Y72_31020, partial [Gemmataceae bacterium]|nr:hypothetical protein [Gemmataceae bacterium]